MTATCSSRASSARASAVVAERCGTSPVSTPVTTTVCHSRPLAAWNVRTSTPATSSASANGLVDATHGAQLGAVAEGLVAEELQHGRGDLALGDVDRVRPSAGVDLEHVVGPRPQPRRRRQCGDGLDDRGERRAGRQLASHDRHAGLGQRRGQPAHLGVRAGEHGDRPRAHGHRVERAHQRGDERRLVVLVVGGDDAHRRAVAAVRLGVAVVPPGPQHGRAGGDDLRRAAVVGRQVDHLDAGHPGGDVAEQARDRSR